MHSRGKFTFLNIHSRYWDAQASEFFNSGDDIPVVCKAIKAKQPEPIEEKTISLGEPQPAAASSICTTAWFWVVIALVVLAVVLAIVVVTTRKGMCRQGTPKMCKSSRSLLNCDVNSDDERVILVEHSEDHESSEEESDMEKEEKKG
jgi:hypothetical protein